FCVAVELGQRWRNELDVAQENRFHFLGVAEQLRVGKYLDLHFARKQFFGNFLELDGALALGRGVSHNVAEFYGDGLLREGASRERQGGAAAQDDENAGYDFLHWVCLHFVLASLEPADCPPLYLAVLSVSKLSSGLFIAWRALFRQICQAGRPRNARLPAAGRSPPRRAAARAGKHSNARRTAPVPRPERQARPLRCPPE